MKTHTKVLAGLLLLAVIAGLFFLPTADWPLALVHWIETHPKASWPAFAGVVIVAVILMLPAWILFIAAGYLFGVVTGVILSSTAYVLGATVTFYVGRTVAHDWAEKRIHGFPKFLALSESIRKNGITASMLARLVMIFPYNVLNYAFGVTPARTKDYVIGTWLGCLPIIILQASIGASATDLAAVLKGEASYQDLSGEMLLVLSVAALLVAAIVIARVMSKSLNRREEEGNETASKSE